MKDEYEIKMRQFRKEHERKNQDEVEKWEYERNRMAMKIQQLEEEKAQLLKVYFKLT